MASLYLIDGHNVLYRTFFGVPRLTAPDGTPTNVVLGVARILLKILREERPMHRPRRTVRVRSDQGHCA